MLFRLIQDYFTFVEFKVHFKSLKMPIFMFYHKGCDTFPDGLIPEGESLSYIHKAWIFISTLLPVWYRLELNITKPGGLDVETNRDRDRERP